MDSCSFLSKFLLIPVDSCSFLSIPVDSCLVPVDSCLNSCGFLWIPAIPVDSCRNQWRNEKYCAFWKLKESVTSAPVLITPVDDQPFRIEADSSDFAMGAVLSQLSAEDEKWHPVAFLSKSLSETERNYEIHDKEMLAIIRALEEW